MGGVHLGQVTDVWWALVIFLFSLAEEMLASKEGLSPM
jgi:hypothetical protein